MTQSELELHHYSGVAAIAVLPSVAATNAFNSPFKKKATKAKRKWKALLLSRANHTVPLGAGDNCSFRTTLVAKGGVKANIRSVAGSL